MDPPFDTDREERQGAWVVLAMFAVLAVIPPIACLWIFNRLDRTAVSDPTEIGPLMGGLTAAALFGIGVGIAGLVLVLYALVRVRMHGPLYLLGAVLTTAMALTPVLSGWNDAAIVPPPEDFDPGDCTVCASDGACVHPWPAIGPRIEACGECRSGRREGTWVFGTRFVPDIASFTFDRGRRHGDFETPLVRGRFDRDARAGDWAWLRDGKVTARGHYVDGLARGRWSCLDENGDESTWVELDRGRVVAGNGQVYRKDVIIDASEAGDETEWDGIACPPPRGAPAVDHFERMILAD